MSGQFITWLGCLRTIAALLVNVVFALGVSLVVMSWQRGRLSDVMIGGSLALLAAALGIWLAARHMPRLRSAPEHDAETS